MDKKGEKEKNTNIFDLLIAIIDFISNLITPKKVISFSILYMAVIQNLILILRADTYAEMYSYKSNAEAVISAFIKGQQPLIFVILVSIIVFLVLAIISLIIHTRLLRREINRLAKERSELMHGTSTIKTHHSSTEP